MKKTSELSVPFIDEFIHLYIDWLIHWSIDSLIRQFFLHSLFTVLHLCRQSKQFLI